MKDKKIVIRDVKRSIVDGVVQYEHISAPPAVADNWITALEKTVNFSAEFPRLRAQAESHKGK